MPAASTTPTLDSLILDLVEWVAREPRRTSDVIDAWRSSCPRLTVWEEAVERSLVERRACPGGEAVVVVTDRGRAELRTQGRAPDGAVRGAVPPPAAVAVSS